MTDREKFEGFKQKLIDQRFKAYYDEKQPGTAEFLRDAIHIYTGFRK